MVKVYQFYPDANLLALIARDDEKAFRTLYDRYWKKLLALAIQKLGSTEEAEDTVQTVFINLWKRRLSLDVKYSFNTYVAAMLKYEVLRKLALQNKEKRIFAAISISQFTADNSTEQWLSYSQLQDDLERSVQQLPSKCQLVFRLSREKGLSEQQISEALQIAPKTVQAHLGKALKMLRLSMQQLLSLVIAGGILVAVFFQ